MDGPFYVDTRPPFNNANGPSLTLTTSLQLLAGPAMCPLLGSNYFGYPGKALRITAFGVCTSGATPVAFNFNFIYGNGTAGNGANVCGVNVTWTANQANQSWMATAVIRCRSTGTSGSVLGVGWLFVGGTGLIPMPATSSAAVTIDTSLNNYITPQLSRGGSTAETAQLTDILFEALN